MRWSARSRRQFPALLSTAVGYMGGTLKDPSYEAVCTGKTGHAEVIWLEYDPTKTSYRDLLHYFWCATVPLTTWLTHPGAFTTPPP